MAFRFEDLKVWQKALQLSNEIDFIARSFPKIEMFSLSLQIKKVVAYLLATPKVIFQKMILKNIILNMKFFVRW